MCDPDPVASVRAALDRAIAEVAEVEYARLAQGLSPHHQAQEVDTALQSLRQLQQGVTPDYNSEWVALFYVTWYQPRQVHLAYAALRQHVSAENPPQYVIDYGCGTWAVQFALAIALTEEHDFGGTGVHGLDPSVPMKNMGERLWARFSEVLKECAPNDDFAERLAISLELMASSSRCHPCLADALPHLPDPHTTFATDHSWLTAVHAIYPTNEPDLRDVLDPTGRDNDPAFALVTFDRYSQKTSFFAALGFEAATLASPWVGHCPATTQWRNTLANRLPEFPYRNFLTNTVAWDPGQRLARGQDVVMIRRRPQ